MAPPIGLGAINAPAAVFRTLEPAIALRGTQRSVAAMTPRGTHPVAEKYGNTKIGSERVVRLPEPSESAGHDLPFT